MAEIVLTTFDWVPEFPRGYVRDIRIRWALEEAGLPYVVDSVPFPERGTDHFRHQPFGQIPWITDGNITVFESGAAVLHVAEMSETLMPSDPKGRSDVIMWLFAALNSVEAASLPWFILRMASEDQASKEYEAINGFLSSRLSRMEDVLFERTWLTDQFSAADIVMIDVLRLIGRFDGLADKPACRSYVSRGTQRPAFRKAYDDQMSHFGNAAAVRSTSNGS